MASPTRWTWVWVNSGRWWTEKPGVLQSMGLQKVRHDWVTELSESVSESHSVVSDSLRPHGLYSPWNSLGQNTGMVAFPFSRGSSPHREQTQVSLIAGGFFTSWATREVHMQHKALTKLFQIQSLTHFSLTGNYNVSPKKFFLLHLVNPVIAKSVK